MKSRNAPHELHYYFVIVDKYFYVVIYVGKTIRFSEWDNEVSKHFS